MAKIWLDRIQKKYGWKGKNYRELIQKIVVTNTNNVHNAVGRVLVRDLKAKAGKLVTGRQVIIPSLQDVLPKRSVHLRKAAEKGALMSDSLRDRLTKNLREVLNQPEYLYRRGRLAGKVKESVILDFQKKITQTFEGYTKRHRREMPTNLATIARTEVRSIISVTKREYMDRLLEKNPELIFSKTWVHVGSKRKGYVPRENHEDLHGVTIPYNQKFKVVNPITKKTYLADHPHDDDLPAGEVINCGCECKYVLVKRKRK